MLAQVEPFSKLGYEKTAQASAKRSRPEPNLIYHVPRSRQLASNLVPVVFEEDKSSSSSAVVAAVHDEATDRTRVVPAPHYSGADQTTTTQAARPQEFEYPTQTILEWRRK